MTILPYVLGSSDAVTGRVTSYASIAANTRLLVMFGGIPMKNTQIESGGIGDHATESWLRRIEAAGVEMVNISPVRDDVADFLDVEMLRDRKSVVEGKSVSVRVDFGGGRLIKKKKKK